MKRAITTLFAIALLGACSAPNVETPSVANQFNNHASAPAPEDIFKRWVDARAGTGNHPVHWVAEGGIYAYPSGEKLFGMIGFDSSTVFWPDTPGEDVIHLTRKTFAYTDPKTGEVLKEYNGNPVKSIAYPYQMITYRMKDGRIYGDVEQGVQPKVQQIKSKNGMTVMPLGKDTLYVNAAVFLDIPIGKDRRLDAWENYDFFIHDVKKVDRPHQMAWQRYGGLPPWAGNGKAIYQLVSWRVESSDDFPKHILDWAKADQPQWLKPPASVEEVRKLQSGEAGEGWSK